jgi:hypothetical protein
MDLRWLADLDPFGAETSGAYEELAQDMYHVVEQDLGSNLDDPTRGLGVANMISGIIPQGFQQNADAMLMADERLSGADCEVVIDTSGGPAATTAAVNVTLTTNDDLLQAINLQVPMGTGANPVF